MGSANAPVTVVEFTDYQCPFCAQFERQALNDLKRLYVDTGKVRLYIKNLPLDIHKNAFTAAIAARCSDEQGKFWAMHSTMQSNPERLEINDLISYAESAGLDASAFQNCVKGGKFKTAVEDEMRVAMANGVNGTPAFVIGKNGESTVSGHPLVGVQPLGAFEREFRAIEK